MQNRHAVVIEDDDDIAMLLHASLSGAGFIVSRASDGAEGIDVVRAVEPAVITLDVGLPGIDGLETTRRIRSFSDAHIIMLTARDEEADILLGLESGADDYVTKPFRPRELRAKVGAIMRRREADQREFAPQASSSRDGRVLKHHGLTLDAEQRTVDVAGRPVTLTRTEFDLLAALLHGRNRVIEKAELIRHLRDDSYQHDSYVSSADKRALEVHIGNLRRKLGEDVTKPRWIVTVRGVGYRLTPADAG